MKLLLTSAGVNNKSIHDALVGMLDKPITESNALCIPTAMYGHPWVGPGVNTWQFISGKSENPMVDLGWKSVGVLELTALPSISKDRWVPLVREIEMSLQQAGIVDGSNGSFSFKSNHMLTRAQMAKMFTLALGIEPGGTGAFQDVPTTHCGYGYIAALAELEIDRQLA